jgi:ribose/xylose/arabinose/galactoside ABC-type transport system permease subunit
MKTNTKSSSNLLKKFLNAKEAGIVIPLILLCLLIGLNNSVFYSFDNIIDVLRNTTYILIIAIGMTFVLIAGGLDLSVGSYLAFCGLICGLGLSAGIPIPLAILLGILAGVVGGVFNAVVIVKLNIPPLITTLGTMYMARGLVLVITKGTPIYPLPKDFCAFGSGSLLGIPYVILIAIVLAVAANWVLNKTVYGRQVYAIGGNEETARFSGINVNRIKASVYIIVTVLAALSGILMSGRLGSAQPSIGDGYEMQVITAVIIGGTSLTGGAGTILGTVFGAIFMSVLSNGMNLVGVSVYWQKFVMGLIIVVAVGIDQYKKRKKA